MSEIVPFVFKHDQDETSIRTLMLDNEPWFVAVDVCRALGLDNTTAALRVLDADETTLITNKGSPGPGLNIVSEPGLYALIGVSRKPAAKIFNRWVRHHVLPTLRKTGRYEMAAAAAAQPDLLAAINAASIEMRAEMRAGFQTLGEKIDGSGRHNFSTSTVRYVCIGLANTNGGQCWYCNDTVLVDKYGVRLEGKSHAHHADGNKANSRPDNCMLACLPNECHAKVTYPNRPDYIPADKAIALAFGFHQRLRQKNGQIRPPDISKDLLEFRPMKQSDMGFRHLVPPASWKRSA